MKKIALLFSCFILLLACGKSQDEKAQTKLDAAIEAFKEGNYSQAKIEIDSIKILYPKAFKARREGIGLMQEVELKEQEVSLNYLDSLEAIKRYELDSIKGQYTFEKNEEYQDIGNYFWPTQTVERNIHRTFLRFQVNERGVFTMTSFFCENYAINHHTIKITAPDGSFAETPMSQDTYQTTNLGTKIEQADFKKGEDGGVLDFIYLNADKTLRVAYIGDKTFNTTILPNDKKALVGIYDLAQILASLEQIRVKKEEANLKIRFVKEKMEQRKEKEQMKNN